MNQPEVYPHAPIVLMVAEVRHSLCTPLDARQVARVSELVREELPLPDVMNTTTVYFQFASGEQSRPRQTTVRFPRWTSRDKRTALSIRQNSLVLETTQYGSYQRVRTLLRTALQARMDIAAPAGVNRVGLRYIDEIRVPEGNDGERPNWSEWVDPALIGPQHIGDGLGLAEERSEGISVFSDGHDVTLVLRYGAQDDYVVQSTPQLRRPLPTPGPLFKLDIDSFWQTKDEVPAFKQESILSVADRLHKPVDGVFESLISEHLREGVLRRD